MVRHEENGLLADFFDLDQMTDWAMKVLDDPSAFRPLGEAGTRMIHEHYSLEQCLPQMLGMYRETLDRFHRADDAGHSR
jgi:hypothetical protein